MSQTFLPINEKPEENQENFEYPLSIIVDDLAKKELLVPAFQREFVWTDDKIMGWAKSIISKMAVGVIVTYQESGGGPKYLADGFQRLTAASKFMDNPQAYKFEFSPKQALIYCKAFKVTIQHRIYENHNTAMLAFQNLNQGTALTPLEYFSGILTLDPKGKLISDKIPELVLSYERPYTQIEKGRVKQATFFRDSFALFYQYISGSKIHTFWRASSPTIRTNVPSIEQLITNYLDDEKISIIDLEKRIASFEKYIAEQIAEIHITFNEVGAGEKLISRSVMRWFLHLSIWKKNAKRPISLYRDFLKALATYLSRYKTIPSRFDLPGVEPVETVTLQTGSIGSLKKLCSVFNVPLYEGQKRRPDKKARPGYQVSHIEPFSSAGEGETIIEPAPRNRERGAKPIEEDLLN